LDTPFDFPSYCALRDVFLRDQPMSRLADVWRLDALYPHPDRLVPFLGNHDTSRFLSNQGATPERMRLALAVLLTMRGMPQVYSGDEIAMSGGDDPDNRRDFPGGWPATTQNAFTTRTPQQAAMHDWVQRLLRLRAQNPALQSGDMQLLTAEKDVLAYARVIPSSNRGTNDSVGKILIVVNRSSQAQPVTLKLGATLLAGTSQPKTLLGDATSTWASDEAQVNMPPQSVWVALIR
jgi:glycosidase